MAAQKKSFEVTVRGQYHARSEHSGIPTLKVYEEIFILPSQEAALSAICKHLLSPRLKKVHSDFLRFRTHELIGIKLVGYTPNPDVLNASIDDMNLLELHDFCILNQIMIDPYKHATKDIFAIREMVKKAYSDKRLAKKELAQSREGAELKEADALRQLNDLPPASRDTVINVNEQLITQEREQKEHAPAPEFHQQGPNDGGAEEALPPFVEDEPVLE